MTSTPRSHHRRPRRWPLALGAALTIALALALAVSVGSGGDAPSGAERTVGTGPMGGQMVATPGSSTGTATAGGILVEGADWHLGHVPLMVTVEPTWTLTNASDHPVAFGQPHADVVEGCCPGPLTLDSMQLEPGERTTLRFPLQMHPGMDGPHDFAIHVPTAAPSGAQSLLTLGVDGDFSG